MEYCPECGEDRSKHEPTIEERYASFVEDCGNADHPPELWRLSQFDDGNGWVYPLLRSTTELPTRWKGCIVTSGTAYVEEWLTYGKCDASWTIVQEDPAYTVERIIFTERNNEPHPL